MIYYRIEFKFNSSIIIYDLLNDLYDRCSALTSIICTAITPFLYSLHPLVFNACRHHNVKPPIPIYYNNINNVWPIFAHLVFIYIIIHNNTGVFRTAVGRKSRYSRLIFSLYSSVLARSECSDVWLSGITTVKIKWAMQIYWQRRDEFKTEGWAHASLYILYIYRGRLRRCELLHIVRVCDT